MFWDLSRLPRGAEVVRKQSTSKIQKMNFRDFVVVDFFMVFRDFRRRLDPLQGPRRKMPTKFLITWPLREAISRVPEGVRGSSWALGALARSLRSIPHV